MDRSTYDRFTDHVTRWAESDPRVEALVAVGSMAAVTHQPDQWSDHDFWVIVADGTEEAIRNDPSWLPGWSPSANWGTVTSMGGGDR